MPGYDFIVCGAGSAGCVLANRLSADPAISVLLLEAGQKAAHPMLSPIGGALELWDTHLDWAFRSVPQANLNDRRILLNRGKALGGSSVLNYAMYVRGNRGDYDQWAQRGNTGWGYDDVLPYFRRAESNARIDDGFHGTDGPLSVEDPRNTNPIHEMYFEAMEDLGCPRTTDFNGATQEGCGQHQYSTREGRRFSAADAWLTPAIDRPNLTVATGAHITGLTVEKSRVTGVSYAVGQTAHHAGAGHVVLSAGAIGSPHILLLSGIGPADEIAPHGIHPVHDLPGVGKNLLDHIIGPSIDMHLKDSGRFGFPVASRSASLAQFEADATGPLATMNSDAGAFHRMRETDEQPSAQMFCTVMNGDRARGQTPMLDLSGYVCRSQSQGQITLATGSPFDRPLIDPRYFSNPDDMERNLEIVAFQLEIARHPALDNIRGEITAPGTSRKEMITATRASASTCWHQTSTCRMGNDPLAVVGPKLNVHGLEGLSICDASVMPTMPSGNTNAPTLMIAEKGSDLLLAQ